METVSSVFLHETFPTTPNRTEQKKKSKVFFWCGEYADEIYSSWCTGVRLCIGQYIRAMTSKLILFNELSEMSSKTMKIALPFNPEHILGASATTFKAILNSYNNKLNVRSS